MKIAVVYNRESKSVINLFGQPNKERIGMKTIRRVTDALKAGGHQVTAVEGDKDLVDRLEEFMPRVVKGERPGMVFNVSYGIQGQARYTHVPSILEMVGIPYVASGPLAHSLALDKVVTKMILRQHGIPTPDFAVLRNPDDDLPELTFPLIVKPKNEAVSFGIKIVQNEEELREAAGVIYEEFGQAVLVEQFIEGREINVGLLGNRPPEALPPVELVFGEGGPNIYTLADKRGKSGRTISHACPAPIGDDLLARAKEISIEAFEAIGCADCARVDMRLDEKGNLYILEINSLPSLGEHGSYLIGADHVGLDFAAVINRLVQVASARYFGTPDPPHIEATEGAADTQVFSHITQRRDEIEKTLQGWVDFPSHTDDPVGIREAVRRVASSLESLRLSPVPELTDERSVWTWQTRRGFEDGVLVVGHLDVPSQAEVPAQMFRREPEQLFGDGIGSSRAPLVMLLYALRAVRSVRRLRHLPLGVLFYTDEGRDGRYSSEIVRAAAERAKRMLVIRPGNPGLVTKRRGQRVYRFRVEGKPIRPGRAVSRRDALAFACHKLDQLARLTSRKERISVSALQLRTDRLPGLLPHRATATVLVTYPDARAGSRIEDQMREAVGREAVKWSLELISDRPPMQERRPNLRLARTLESLAERWEIPLAHESSVWPSAAGLAPARTATVCGLGPPARDLGTPQECVERIGLIQRTLLLAGYFVKLIEESDGRPRSAKKN